MRSFFLFSVLVCVILAQEETDQEQHPVGVDSALIAHVQETGLERVMRVKRYCGCCGGCCGCGCMCGTAKMATGCPCMGCCG